MEGTGFAQSMGAFGKMLKIQEAITENLPKSKVPWNESRKFLKSITIDDIKATSLYKFHVGLFKKFGLGNLQLIGFAPMNYIYGVAKCPVCSLYPALNNQKVCTATTDALYRFFTEALEIECNVEEIECVKNGDSACKFKVGLQPISAYKILIDEIDKNILTGQSPLDIDSTEYKKRIELLSIYKLIEENKMSEIGKTYMQYAGNLSYQEKVFDPPWKKHEELESIAKEKGTFGAAFGAMKDKSTNKEGNSQKIPSEENPFTKAKPTNNGNDSAKNNDPNTSTSKGDSFSDLLSKMKKKK